MMESKFVADELEIAKKWQALLGRSPLVEPVPQLF